MGPDLSLHKTQAVPIKHLVPPRDSTLIMCVCVCVFIKLHITAQSGPVILVILCHSH